MPQPAGLRALDAVEIRRPELPAPMKNVDVVTEGTVAPRDIGTPRLGQNPWRKPMEESDLGVGRSAGVNGTCDRFESPLREEEVITLGARQTQQLGLCVLPATHRGINWPKIVHGAHGAQH